MKVRNILGLAAAVPAVVVALATPGNAVSAGVVTFAGQITVRPTAAAQPQGIAVCFFAPRDACANGAPSTGAAIGGVAAAPAVDADAVDGLQVSGTYVETCVAGAAMPPVATAQLSGSVHKAVADAWSPDVSATWIRAGLVAVIKGDAAVGTALFTPVSAPLCGQPVDVAVAGAVALTY